MRRAAWLAGTALLVATLAARPAGATPYDQRSAGGRAFYVGLAVVANATPIVSAFYAPRCLPGYVLCKAVFAGVSLVAAGGQLTLSGGGDLAQTRAILYRGFAGDWYLTGRHTSGDAQPELLPDPPAAGGNSWQPPPL